MVQVFSPLNIFIVWHTNFIRGSEYANYLYSELCRDVKHPLNRGLGLPVFFRCQIHDNNSPLDIDFSLAERNAVIVFVDDEMFDDDSWTEYFKSIAINEAKNKRIYPVSFSKYSFSVAPEMNEQFIRLHTITHQNETVEFKNRCKKLKSEILHDLSRLMLDMKPSHETSKDFSHQPVKLFISHAKKDGESIAINFRNYIRTATKLSSFFDANDIANGYDFADEIIKGVKNSVLVVFQTDEYATREWCRIEMITAKRYKSPIVIVNAVNKGEKRSFPYCGNAPTIRWDSNFDDIIDLALYQMLYNLYNEQLLKVYIKLYTSSGKNEVAYSTLPPELFNYIDIVKLKKQTKKCVLVLYPDPPLGHEELKLLNEVDDGITFTTPVMLPKYKF